MDNQAIAAFLAAEFNKIAPSRAKKIEVIDVSVVQAKEKDGKPIYFNGEKLLLDHKDKFTKWSNNTGNKKVKQLISVLGMCKNVLETGGC